MALRRSLLPATVVLVLAVPGVSSAFTSSQLATSVARESSSLGPWSSILVKDLDSGQTLYSLRPDMRLIPASNQKLFTTSVALMRHGPDATISTTLRAPVANVLDPVTGILPGNIYLVGAGDPTLQDTNLRALARSLREAGVLQIGGGIIADENYFDTRRGSVRTNWKFDLDIGGQLSALSYRHGRTGSALAAANRLATLIEATGTSIAGPARRGRLVQPGTELAAVASPTVAQLARMINVPSENFYAEVLAKQLGAAFGTGGTTPAGMAVMRSTLAESAGISPVLADGSGLSRNNRTSTRQLVRLLETLHQDPVAGLPFAASLPRAGLDGTLKRRMRGSAAAGNCAAKTGTLIGVSSLAGYCTTAGGATVAFAMIENRVNSGVAKLIEDRVVKKIVRYG